MPAFKPAGVEIERRAGDRARNSSFGVPFVLAHGPYMGAAGKQAGQAEDEAMQTQNRFFDDLARVASGAMGTLSGVRSEVGRESASSSKKCLREWISSAARSSRRSRRWRPRHAPSRKICKAGGRTRIAARRARRAETARAQDKTRRSLLIAETSQKARNVGLRHRLYIVSLVPGRSRRAARGGLDDICFNRRTDPVLRQSHRPCRRDRHRQ